MSMNLNNDEAHKDLARKFRVLGNPLRLKIISILASAGSKTVGEIVGLLGRSQSTVSTQLRCLYKAGLVVLKKQNQQHYYSINMEALQFNIVPTLV